MINGMEENLNTLLTEIVERNYKNVGLNMLEVNDSPRNIRVNGASIYSRKEGVFDNVYYFDFKSLYPSIIRSFNISFETLSPKGEIETLTEARFIDGGIREGVIPYTLRVFMGERLKFKETDKEKADRFKLLANAVYGNLCNPRSKLYAPLLAESVTSMGRYLNSYVCLLVEHKLNGKVICGHTDSILFTLENTNSNLSVQDLTETLNKMITEHLMERFNIKNSIISLEFVKCYTTLYNHAVSRRIGVYGNNEFDVIGFECINRSYPKIIRDAELDVLKSIVLKEDKSKMISYKNKAIEAIKSGTLTFEDLSIKQTLGKNIEEYNNRTFLSRIAKRRNSQRGDELEYVMLNTKTYTALFRDEVKDGEPIAYDKIHYLENLLRCLNRIIGVDKSTEQTTLG